MFQILLAVGLLAAAGRLSAAAECPTGSTLVLNGSLLECEVSTSSFFDEVIVEDGAQLTVSSASGTNFTAGLRVAHDGAVVGEGSSPVLALQAAQAELDTCRVNVPDVEVPVGVLPPNSTQETVCVTIDFENSTQVEAVFSHDFDIVAELMEQELANGGNPVDSYQFSVREDS